MSESDAEFVERVFSENEAQDSFYFLVLNAAARDRLLSLARKGADWQAMKDERDVAKTGYQNLLAENELHGDEITALRAENERLSKDYQTARDAHDRMLAENFSLSAWQCVYIDGKTGLVGDEHGNQYCAMSKRVDALRAKVEKLEGAIVVWQNAYKTGRNEPLVQAYEHSTSLRATLGDTHE